VLVVAGPGNNAGDALFAAAELPDLLGRTVPLWVWPVAGRTHADGLAAALHAGAVVVDAARALTPRGRRGLVIDGLSGLGGRPGLPDAVAVARAATEARVPVSGRGPSLRPGRRLPGRALLSFAADVTVTFIARKLAQVAQPAASGADAVELVDIGVPVAGPTPWSVVRTPTCAPGTPGPPQPPTSTPGGSSASTPARTAYPGRRAARGRRRPARRGRAWCATPDPARERVLATFPSVVAPLDPQAPGRVQAWVCGSGWPGPDPDRLARRLRRRRPHRGRRRGADRSGPDRLPPGCLLTPHAGELARLLGVQRSAVEEDPVHHAREAARRTGATVLLKGATQYCVRPDGAVMLAEPGPAWSATAGSGDTLAGIAGALLAAGLDAWRAGAVAASLQARAAAILPGPRTPSEVASHGLPDAIIALRAPD
jgi:NAD(P)H-hydrate repair Nnr-like enzyme with NAD(P)H-hydrate epimerase domain